ncbi:hypothetical protein SAMN04488168_10921 [Bacillus sp. 491mf]|uniref:hypothetical protein n=1 Tax=Bacillus sp. 491mf TaxID=1761755 RepID=UPI0008DF24E7|nr:hypothetical protein [Bacillus sp. 491mf]SFC75385.1 hypothetical protein SAMN04488168_10921 [Bacillus sp. 491mf]
MMNVWIEVLKYGTYIITIISAVIAIRKRNDIDWFYFGFLFAISGASIAITQNNWCFGMLFCDIVAFISMFLTIKQAMKQLTNEKYKKRWETHLFLYF